jgi:hypothetical protein
MTKLEKVGLVSKAQGERVSCMQNITLDKKVNSTEKKNLNVRSQTKYFWKSE